MAKITYNTRMDEEIIKKLKLLAIEQGKRQNELLEEAIRDLLEKYEQAKLTKKYAEMISSSIKLKPVYTTDKQMNFNDIETAFLDTLTQKISERLKAQEKKS
jgi:predicted DNA-binding protein